MKWSVNDFPVIKVCIKSDLYTDLYSDLKSNPHSYHSTCHYIKQKFKTWKTNLQGSEIHIVSHQQQRIKYVFQ